MADDPQIVVEVQEIIAPRERATQPDGMFRPTWWRWLQRFVATVNTNFESVVANEATSALSGQIDELRAEIAQLRLQVGGVVQPDDVLPPTPAAVLDPTSDWAPAVETGHLAIRDAFERFASVTVTRDAANAGGNQAILAGSQSGAAPGRPVTLSVAAGSTDANVGIALLPKGTGAITTDVPDGLAAGGNARGTNAIDFQNFRTSAGQVASGQNATILAGVNHTASGQNSACLWGQDGIASGAHSMASGFHTNALGSHGVAIGNRSTDRGNYGTVAHASGRFVVDGDAQVTHHILRGTGATAAAFRLTADGTAASAANTIALPDNTAYSLTVDLIAWDVTTGKACLFSLGQSLIQRGAGVATTAVSAGNPVFVAGPTSAAPPVIGTVPTFAADVALGSCDITFTPPAANTDTWRVVAYVRCTEVQ